MWEHDSFDEVIERRKTDSIKWTSFDNDVAPMWVADMDFRSPPPVIDALCRRAQHGVFGYPGEPPELRDIVVERIQRLYGWTIDPDALLFLPNVAVGFNLAAQAVLQPGDSVLIQPPVYFPILAVPKNARAQGLFSPLVPQTNGRYAIDLEDFEAVITDRTRMFILCNPHNPVGRAFTRAELEQLAAICLRHDLTICSDEIHADFIFDGRRHIPIASLSREVEARTITLFAPSKTFNVAGLHCAVAVVPDKALRERVVLSKRGLVSSVGIMGFAGALAAYRDGSDWFEHLLPYLQDNRDLVLSALDRGHPRIPVTPIEATYLAWLDCRALEIPGDPYEFLLREARVATVPGAIFGPEGEGYVRLNFGCPRPLLQDGLDRIRRAVGRFL